MMPQRASGAESVEAAKRAVDAYVAELRKLPPDEQIKVAREMMREYTKTLVTAAGRQVWRHKQPPDELTTMHALLLALRANWELIDANLDL
jgi:hypothetical protein